MNLYTALSVFLFRVKFSDFLMNATFYVYVFFIFFMYLYYLCHFKQTKYIFLEQIIMCKEHMKRNDVEKIYGHMCFYRIYF